MTPSPDVRLATAADYQAVMALLEAAGLPPRACRGRWTISSWPTRAAGLAGAIGLERYGSAALLRSAVVRPGDQGTGIGAALVRAVLDRARNGEVQEIYLLTTTAERWFPRFGFTPIERDAGARGRARHRWSSARPAPPPPPSCACWFAPDATGLV